MTSPPVMAGLVPAIHPDGLLFYVGADLIRRVAEHREGIVKGLTKRYGLKRLVCFEPYDDIRTAIQREKNMKHRSRTRKVRLILASDSQWRDLFGDLIQGRGWPGQARP